LANQSGKIPSPPVGEGQGEGELMLWLYDLIYPKEKYIWAQVRILHETDKAILVKHGIKIWIPKSQIHGIRLRNNTFEIYVKESTIG
jgi:hypothetical protein